MTGGIDEMQCVLDAICGAINNAGGLGLDGDAPLALQVHGVQHLLRYIAATHRVGDLQHTVGKRGFPMVDMGDDGKVSYQGFIRHG